MKLPIAENDIVLFVGPNNVGKSQALKDIYIKCEKNSSTLVVTDIKTVKEGMLAKIKKTSDKTKQ